MRRFVTGKRLAAGMAAASFATALTLAGGAPAFAASQPRAAAVLNFTVYNNGTRPDDGGFTGTDNVVDPDGNVIGSASERCGVTDERDLACDAEISLAGGRLYLRSNLVERQAPFDFAATVTGGTGDYAGAHGRAYARAITEGVYRFAVSLD